MPDKCQLSVIIVTWNSESEIEECLISIIENSKELSFEIIIIDNNSSDGTINKINLNIEKNPGIIRLIRNKENSGFTKACNQGIGISHGEKILLLNPDTKIINSSLNKLSEKLDENENTGVTAPQLLNSDGSIQSSCRSFPDYLKMFCELTFLSVIFKKSNLFNGWKMGGFDHSIERYVDQPMGAALMIKSGVLKKTGNFDGQFCMFFNDVDLCKRIKDKGYGIIFYPEAKMYHIKGVSIYKDRERMIKIWTGDCLKYFRKHNYNFILYFLLYISLKISSILRIFYFKITK